MMKTFCVVVGTLCFLCQGAFAVDYRGVGNWADPNGWSDGAPPSGAEEVKIRGEETILTLNTSTGDWGAAQRLRVYEGATLIIEEGAELLGAGWARIGAGGAGYVQHTGGLVKIDNDRLGIGDSAGSDGHYTMSGGTLTYAGDRGDLQVGARGGKGVFTVVGTKPVIQMGRLIVGDAAGASGTVEFQVTVDGVSPIVTTGSPAIDALGDETVSALVISSAGGAPQADVLLVDLADGVTATAHFDTVNGEPAVEAAKVVVRDDLATYNYTLTYAGGAAGNDIVLRFVSYVPAPKVVFVAGRFDANDVRADQGWIDWLVAKGYAVDARRGYWVEPLDPNRIAELEAADLILVSGLLPWWGSDYAGDGEAAKWNSLATPLINLNADLAGAYWHWMDGLAGYSMLSTPGPLLARDPNHPIFAGVALDPNGLVKILDPNAASLYTRFVHSLDVGNGKLLASMTGHYPAAWIAEWVPGVEFYAGSGQFAGGWRMMFMAGSSDPIGGQNGEFNLNEAGQQILRNMMAYLLAKEVEQAPLQVP